MSQVLLSTKQSIPKWQTLSFNTPYWLYALHRILFRMTNGAWNDGLSHILKIINGQYPIIESDGSVFNFDDKNRNFVSKYWHNYFNVI